MTNTPGESSPENVQVRMKSAAPGKSETDGEKKEVDPEDLTSKHDTDLSSDKSQQIHQATNVSVVPVFKYYGRETTAHGLPRIAADESLLGWKIFWLVIFLAATGAMIWQLEDNISSYLERTVEAKISIQTSRNLEFPSVTICNKNPLRKSKLKGTRYADIVSIDEALENQEQQPLIRDFLEYFKGGGGSHFEDTPSDSDADIKKKVGEIQANNPGVNSDDLDRVKKFYDNDPIAESDTLVDDNDFLGLLNASQTGDYSDVLDYFRPTVDEIVKLGHQKDEFILTCSFNQRRCDHTDFVGFPNQRHGNCFTFNHNINRDVSVTSKVGSLYGLRLVLNLDPDEYLGMLAHSVGARVVVHPYNVTPFPEEQGVDVAPGMETGIGIKLLKIQRHELSKCFDASTGTPIKTVFGSTFNYSVQSCQDECLQTHLLKECDCIDKLSLTNASQHSYCESTNQTQRQCQQTVRALYSADELSCDCRNPCLELNYQTRISSSGWPSERFRRILTQRYSGELKTNYTTDQFGKGLVMVHVFFEELSFEEIVEYEAYPIAKLLSDVGGACALWIGMSVCTFFELFELVGALIAATVLKYQQRIYRVQLGRKNLREDSRMRMPSSEWKMHKESKVHPSAAS